MKSDPYRSYSASQIRDAIAGFSAPDRSRYPELDGYSRDALYEDCFGGGGLYLATRMLRTMRVQPGDIVLDLGCGKGTTSVFLAQRSGAQVIAADLWTSPNVLHAKIVARRLRDRIVPLQLDVTRELPFAESYFDAIFCMNSFNFYGDSVEFLGHLLPHLKRGGQLCIGSEVLTSEFTPEQLSDPPYVYAFQLPPPDEHVDVFEGDFRRQHTPAWWHDLFERSGLLKVEYCDELDDAAVLYQEMVRIEYEHNLDPFDVQICLQQMEWDRSNQPRRSLFVITVCKL